MVRQGLENARLLGRAIAGNAFEQLPTHFSAYIETVSHEAPILYNPANETIIAQMVQQSYDAQNRQRQKDLLAIPWTTRRGQARIKPSRLAASIIAFSDAQGKKTIDEFFPVQEIQTFLAQVASVSSQSGRPLTIPEQFAVALRITNDNPVAASLLAHSSYRAIARGKETKISSHLVFPLEEVMRVSRSTADFHTVNAPARDPLGETYHWWASFSAGLGFTLAREEHPIQSRLYTTAFYHEAALTTFVRKTVLHKPGMIKNHHKDVDRQGLQAGITMGNFLKN